MLNADTQSQLFETYRYLRICGDYDHNGESKSLPYLCALANTTPETEGFPDRQERYSKLSDRLPKKYRRQIALIERSMLNRETIDADCTDDKLMSDTILELKQVLRLIPNNSKKNTKIRIELLDNLYNIYEIFSPNTQTNRFEVLKQKVKNIKNNDGSFDHHPLNISALQIDFFMKKISAQERYSLILQIEKKTIDHKKYDYTDLKKRLSIEYQKEKLQQKLKKKEQDQQRYKQIHTEELPEAEDNKTRIKLYNEMLTLVNNQNWGRTRKFEEKATIYKHLIRLYQAEGMYKQVTQARNERDKFINAYNISKEAAQIKGYPNNGKGYPNNNGYNSR